MFKENLGICLYEENYYEEEIIKIQNDIEETDKEPIEVIGKVSNEKSTKKSTKKLTKELIEESNKEPTEVIDRVSNDESNKELAKKMCEVLNKYSDDSDKELDEMFKELTKSNKESNEESNKESNKELNKESNKRLNKELIETISPKNDENTIDWYDKNKFNKILTTTDSNNFNHKNKIGKLKFNYINDLINNIKNNTISEANAKKKINELNKIKKVETKGKHLINSQKTLLSLFDDLKTIFNNNNNNNSNNGNNNDSDSENENDSVNKDENENENESDDEKYYENK